MTKARCAQSGGNHLFIVIVRLGQRIILTTNFDKLLEACMGLG